MSMLLANIAYTWEDFFKKSDGTSLDWTGEWLSSLITILSNVLWVALAIVGAAGAIYAIWIGVKMAKAESSDEREEAKKHLINVVVAIVAVIALIVVFNTLLPMILSACGLGVINET